LHAEPKGTTELSAQRIFDAKHYELLNSSRAAVVSKLLLEIKSSLGLQTTVDVGCGLGYFSGLLLSLGLEVTAVDGRAENVEEAKRRYQGVKFGQGNAEDSRLKELGQFDLVFCFGLLYHLENPLLAIRHLHEMTKKLLLVEGVIFPGEEPTMALVDEEVHEDQGLNHIAFYPTEACLVKMLYRSEFSHVYGFARQPDHPDYQAGSNSRRVRTILVASRDPIASQLLVAMPEPSTVIRPWDSLSGAPKPSAFQKLGRFVKKPLPDKVETVKRIVKGRTSSGKDGN
jgi:SAM-dependent methyltransferase